jgi:hypothetical protein
MKTFPSILSACLFSLNASVVQAVPIIHVTNEYLSMRTEVTLEQPPDVYNTYSDSFSGSLFSGDHTVDAYMDTHYIPSHSSPGLYYEVGIVMNADFTSNIREKSAEFSTRINNDVYGGSGAGGADPDEIVTSVDYGTVITIDMDFYVTGGDAEIGLSIYNEGTYGPVAISLTDVTTSTQVVDLTREWVGRDNAVVPLLDGHRYVLNMMASELIYDPSWYIDDDDIYTEVRFDNARLVRASEPAIPILLYVALAALGIVRWRRHGNGITQSTVR